MRKAALLTAIAVLVGGCSSLDPPPSLARPEPVPERVEPPPDAPPPQPAPQPRAAAPRPRAAEPRIDNSSLDAFRTSWERLRASLTPEQRAMLSDAVTRLAFSGYAGAATLPVNLRNSPIVPELIRDRLAGLTYAEIVALAP
jgi:hypothetical protein